MLHNTTPCNSVRLDPQHLLLPMTALDLQRIDSNNKFILAQIVLRVGHHNPA
jgi:hypothetical protein